ncbi:MAG: DNA mismatch repair endonuclease MutL [Flavobacteriaceae bacterium]|jgi:DNA mismatch repair protein MutL|nr:DNA mismatch repair endonuclease MutL [Flavobacteriaceae bacterium]
MSNIIRLLPDHVANQIAAGEVVQRPSSVVKELVENAIDAGATEIKIILKEAGKTLIQVIDNGKGMGEIDARMAFERHATSKITCAEDLFALRTKGFRGEALASIAAIAHVDLKTCQEGQEIGTHVVIEGSKVTSQEAVVVPKGTVFSVKNLFFNVPARRNFLKSDTVEFRHIVDEFERVALVHHAIQFTLIHNGSEVFSLGSTNLRQRIVSVFGSRTNEKLVPVNEVTDIVTVEGFIGKPEYAKKSRGEQFFFVNDRFVKSGYLHHALIASYEGLLKEGTHPSYFVYLTLPPDSIDINIHPTKTEVKFDDEQALYSILRSTIKHSLGQFNVAPVLDFQRESAFDVPYDYKDKEAATPTIEVDTFFNPFANQGINGGQSDFNPFDIEPSEMQQKASTIEARLYGGLEPREKSDVEGENNLKKTNKDKKKSKDEVILADGLNSNTNFTFKPLTSEEEALASDEGDTTEEIFKVSQQEVAFSSKVNSTKNVDNLEFMQEEETLESKVNLLSPPVINYNEETLESKCNNQVEKDFVFDEIPEVEFASKSNDINYLNLESEKEETFSSKVNTISNKEKTFKREQTFSSKANNKAWEQVYEGLKREGGSIDVSSLQVESEIVTSSLFENTNEVAIASKSFQIHRKYIVSPIKSGMLIIDQGRAHQRILYENFIENMNVNKASSQQLLFPLTLYYAPYEIELFRQMRSALEYTGFGFEQFGEDFVVISGLPVHVAESEASIVLEDLLGDFQDGIPDSLSGLSTRVAKSLAQSLSVKTGTVLSEEEQENIVNSLFACKEPNVSPFMKPTFVTMKLEDIEKKFTL